MPQVTVNPALLISDDDRDLRESLGVLFESRGFKTFLAGDGVDAFHVVQQHDVHLALIDFHMPRMSGLQALKRIKQFNCRLPVILMSAQLDDQLQTEIMAAQAFSVHSKPLDIGQVRADVSMALQQIYGWLMDC